MKLTIEIEMDNVAFEPGNNGSETARILRGIALEVDGEEIHPQFRAVLRDVNGNEVGRMKASAS